MGVMKKLYLEELDAQLAAIINERQFLPRAKAVNKRTAA